MIVQVFRIHIKNDIVSKPRVATTMNRNSNPVWCVYGIYIATCISEYIKVVYSLSCTFKTWMQCVVYIFVGLPSGYGIRKEIKL